MFRRIRTRMRGMVQNALVRAHGMMTRMTAPTVVHYPMYYYGLKKLLKLYYNSDVEIVEETVDFRTPPEHFPHVFQIGIGLKVLDNPDALITNLAVIAKVLGHVEKEELERQNIYFRFERETIMYKKVIPEITRFQKSLQPICEIEFCNLFPMCYGASLSLVNEHAEKPDHSAAILTTNLKCSSYDYEDINEPCDIAESQLIVRRLAHLHAMPLAMWMQERPQYRSRIEPLLHNTNEYKNYLDLDSEYEKICKAISSEPELTPYKEEILWQLQRYVDNTHKDQVEENPSWITICHSECSIRNIIYKRENETGPADVKFVNLGDAEINSCCSDLIFFMLTSTTNDVLDVYFDTILVTYFSEFSGIMLYDLVGLRLLSDHTYEEFVTEFESRAESNVGHILFEIGRMYYYGADGNEPVRGTTYNSKIVDILKFMVTRGWL